MSWPETAECSAKERALPTTRPWQHTARVIQGKSCFQFVTWRMVTYILYEASSHLTTFDTPWGRYIWKHLPFGLKVSSEIFQKRLHQTLEGLDVVSCVADDIIVLGGTKRSSTKIWCRDAIVHCSLFLRRSVGLWSRRLCFLDTLFQVLDWS